MTTPYKPYGLQALRDELSRDEDRRTHLYNDEDGETYHSKSGKLTIGVGWNVETNGLPEDVIDLLLDRGIEEAEQALDHIERRWRLLDSVRQRALLNMAFNLGQSRLSLFRKMWEAIGLAIENNGSAMYWERAAAEALDSKWATQVGPRATRIATMLKTGEPA